jgi:ornithine carbamoyltransferase
MTTDQAGTAVTPNRPSPPPGFGLDSSVQFDADALVASARALREAHRASRPQGMLRGKYIALLGGGAEAEVNLLLAAAAALGARVTPVQTGLSAASADKDVQDVAGMLGRLYDAVECDGLPVDVVRRLALAVDVPLFERLASAAHPTAQLAARLGPEATPGENRLCMLQAALVCAMT